MPINNSNIWTTMQIPILANYATGVGLKRDCFNIYFSSHNNSKDCGKCFIAQVISLSIWFIFTLPHIWKHEIPEEVDFVDQGVFGWAQVNLFFKFHDFFCEEKKKNDKRKHLNASVSLFILLSEINFQIDKQQIIQILSFLNIHVP